MANYNQLAQDIVRLVGGENNVISLAHCVTRLRFKLKNASLAKTDEIKKLDGVIKVMEAGGQYQVVIGTDVGDVYDIIVANYHITATGEQQASAEETAADTGSTTKEGIVSTLIDIVSSIFTPFLGAFTGAGLLKGSGYERWAKVFNLKQLSKSVALLSEYGVHTEAELANQISRFKTESSESLAVVKDLENRIGENRERSRHVSAYLQNRKFAQQVKTAKKSEAFRELHRAELTAYQAAAAYFKAHNIKKLPSLKQLKAEREELISEKAQFYQKYRETRKAWLDLSTAQQNLEALHRAEGRREMTRGGLHELDK